MYNTEHVFFSWVSLCPLMLSASTQKFKFSMNSLPSFFSVYIDSLISVLLLLLSRFSRVWLCATPETAAHQVPHPWDSPGKNTGVGCHFLLHVYQICISTTYSCSGTFTLKFCYKQICILSESWLMCLLHLVLKNYMLIIQVFNNLCLFSTEILVSSYIMIELESNIKYVGIVIE